jgi:pimeloyl-ACP methyl ester carboxylesterase
VTVPVLTMAGSKSDGWMQNAQKAIAANLPHAEYKTLEGQNHMVAATAIAPVIKEFLAA